MRVVLAHGPENNVREVRQVLHSAGADCAAEDCVLWEELPARLGQAEFDLVVVHAGPAASVNWATINEAKAFTAAPLLAIGPNGESNAKEAAQQAGVAEYIEQGSLRQRLDEALFRLVGEGEVRCDRGLLVAVHSPLGGSGGAFVALNLAGQFAKEDEAGAAIVELSAGRGKLGLMVDLEPEYELEEICRRLHRLDRRSLAQLLYRHDTGLRFLINSPSQPADRFLQSDHVRRIIVLARMAAKKAVMFLGDRLDRVQADAVRLCDQVLLVMRPDVPSLNRTIAAREELADIGVSSNRISVVVNQWGRKGSLAKNHLQEALETEDLQYIPADDGRVNRALNEGWLFQEKYGRSRVGRSIAKLAKSLKLATAQ